MRIVFFIVKTQKKGRLLRIWKNLSSKMNLIAFSDGKRNIFEIAKELNVPLSKILKEYKLLKKFKILK